VDGAPAPPNTPPPTPVIDTISGAKFRAISFRERIASGGGYAGSDRNCLIPKMAVPPDWIGKPADVIIDSSGVRWTALEDRTNRLGLTYYFVCRALSLVNGLSDEINIERATISYDTAGAAVKAFPPPGGAGTNAPIPITGIGAGCSQAGSTIYQRLKARVQPQRTEVRDERGLRGPVTKYDIIVEKQLWITTEDRVLWNGQYLDIIGYRQAERIDELPIVEAELRP
jgi:hypothetical protein